MHSFEKVILSSYDEARISRFLGYNNKGRCNPVSAETVHKTTDLHTADRKIRVGNLL